MCADGGLRRVAMLALAAGLGVATPLFGQAAAGAGSAPAYDVVSVKPDKRGDGMVRILQGDDKYSGTNVTLKMLLRYAYKLTTEDQIAGLPGWAESGHWDVEAKMDGEAIAALKTMSKEDSAEARRKMMQAMLAERFQMKVHPEQKEMSLYDLVVAKGGFKLKDADPNNPYANGIKGIDGIARPGMMMVGNGRLTAQAIPMSNLASYLAQMLHKQVIDKTGLAGKYDIVLKWQPDEMPGESHETTGGETLPSIFTVLQEELGLRLDAVKGPVDVIVVDHVEMPSEN